MLRFCWTLKVLITDAEALLDSSSLLYSSGEADDREEETVQVKVLEHALNRMSVNAEGDTGHT